MLTLHTVNKSPFTHMTIKNCLRFASQGSSILLLEDGVYGSLIDSYCVQLSISIINYSFYALISDVEARGITDKVLAHFTLIDYDGFVHLVETHDKIQAWS